MHPRSRLRFCLAACCAAFAVPALAADAAPAVAPQDLDPTRIYRFDLLTEQFHPIDRGSLKPGYVYHRYSPTLGRWVWSKANADRSLSYAMGPGSVQARWLFDLTATLEERRRELEKRAPELARLYGVQGARAAVILGPDGRWELQGASSKGHVYDLETGQRWEWHGDHRAGVVHAGGNSWMWQDGRLVPAWAGAFAGTMAGVESCRP